MVLVMTLMLELYVDGACGQSLDGALPDKGPSEWHCLASVDNAGTGVPPLFTSRDKKVHNRHCSACQI